MRRRSAFLLCLLLSACLWRSYDDILAVHVDVLLGMADKIVAKSEAGRRPTPNDLTELLYPLQRARQFAGQFRAQSGRGSYRAFGELLDRYEELVKKIDAARADDARWAALRTELPQYLEDVGRRGDEVRAALVAEGM